MDAAQGVNAADSVHQHGAGGHAPQDGQGRVGSRLATHADRLAGSALLSMTLGAGKGDPVEVSSDDPEALATIADLVAQDLDARRHAPLGAVGALRASGPNGRPETAPAGRGRRRTFRPRRSAAAA